MLSVFSLPCHLVLAESAATPYWPILLMLGLAIGFAIAVMIGTHLLGPGRQGSVKGSVYEAGVDAVTSPRKRFHVRYYLLAMTFLVFDVEIIFLYPWATTFRQISMDSALATQFVARITFFTLTGIIAYVYAWRKGVFRFD